MFTEIRCWLWSQRECFSMKVLSVSLQCLWQRGWLTNKAIHAATSESIRNHSLPFFSFEKITTNFIYKILQWKNPQHFTETTRGQRSQRGERKHSENTQRSIDKYVSTLSSSGQMASLHPFQNSKTCRYTSWPPEAGVPTSIKIPHGQGQNQSRLTHKHSQWTGFRLVLQAFFSVFMK